MVTLELMFEFPDKKGKYAYVHLEFLKIMVNLAGYSYTETTKDINGGSFFFKYNEKLGIIDYQDMDNIYPEYSCPIFKAHYSKYIIYPSNIVSFAPMLGGYAPSKEKVSTLFNMNYNYNPISGFTNQQRIYGNAKKRRTFIKSLLKNSNHDVSFNITNIVDYWNTHSNKLGAICVPGQNNNMLDRGQAELMLLGVCTISPELPEIIMGEPLIANKHYLKCKNDYSDLLEILDNITPNKAKLIGNNAKQFMKKYKSNNFIKWIITNME